MNIINDKYINACVTPSDINEHIVTLNIYAQKCNHVTECGVRGVTSSWAFAAALVNRPNTKLVMVDIESNSIVDNFLKLMNIANLNTIFYEQCDLVCPMEETDLLFIDTWHVYGHLKRELARWHSSVRKYIILHDTTIDAEYGETIRGNSNAIEQSRQSGIPIEEINKGLWPAVTEFLEQNHNWRLEKRYENNNGLTILSRNTI